MYNYQLILARSIKLENDIKQLEASLQDVFIGDLQVSKDRESFRWRILSAAPDGTVSRITLPKTKRGVAEEAAETKLLRAHLEDLRQEYKACQRYLAVFKTRSGNLPEDILPREQALLQNPGIIEKELLDWEQADYPNGRSHYPDQLNVKVWNGLIVRSKSERSLAMLLKEFGLHFRFEWLQDIGGGKMLPDFTILHPQTGIHHYLEHAGLMNEQNYLKYHFQKLKQYASAGIYPGDRLLITYDTPDRPLDLELARYQLQRMF